ncbi:4'-phosphopantetheinyl transferase superfamily protein OS=Streptomyces rochei OX=1928 GN=G3I25_17255 PE=3 SV=1 [Streptomyces rochei]
MDRFLLSVACHNAGLSTAGDTSVGTMLDQGFLSAMTDTGQQ